MGVSWTGPKPSTPLNVHRIPTCERPKTDPELAPSPIFMSPSKPKSASLLIARLLGHANPKPDTLSSERMMGGKRTSTVNLH